MMERWLLYVNVSILSCFYSETLANLVPKKIGSAIHVGPDHCRVFLYNWKPNTRLTPIQGYYIKKKSQNKDICLPVWEGNEGKEHQLGQDMIS